MIQFSNQDNRHIKTNLQIKIRKTGSLISLKGCENYDSLRGVGINFLVIDESADVSEIAWTAILRPTLADTKGRALFAGTPKGLNMEL